MLRFHPLRFWRIISATRMSETVVRLAYTDYFRVRSPDRRLSSSANY